MRSDWAKFIQIFMIIHIRADGIECPESMFSFLITGRCGEYHHHHEI